MFTVQRRVLAEGAVFCGSLCVGLLLSASPLRCAIGLVFGVGAGVLAAILAEAQHALKKEAANPPQKQQPVPATSEMDRPSCLEVEESPVTGPLVPVWLPDGLWAFFQPSVPTDGRIVQVVCDGCTAHRLTECLQALHGGLFRQATSEDANFQDALLLANSFEGIMTLNKAEELRAEQMRFVGDWLAGVSARRRGCVLIFSSSVVSFGDVPGIEYVFVGCPNRQQRMERIEQIQADLGVKIATPLAQLAQGSAGLGFAELEELLGSYTDQSEFCAQAAKRTGDPVGMSLYAASLAAGRAMAKARPSKEETVPLWGCVSGWGPLPLDSPQRLSQLLMGMLMVQMACDQGICPALPTCGQSQQAALAHMKEAFPAEFMEDVCKVPAAAKDRLYALHRQTAPWIEQIAQALRKEGTITMAQVFALKPELSLTALPAKEKPSAQANGSFAKAEIRHDAKKEPRPKTGKPAPKEEPTQPGQKGAARKSLSAAKPQAGRPVEPSESKTEKEIPAFDVVLPEPKEPAFYDQSPAEEVITDVVPDGGVFEQDLILEDVLDPIAASLSAQQEPPEKQKEPPLSTQKQKHSPQPEAPALPLPNKRQEKRQTPGAQGDRRQKEVQKQADIQPAPSSKRQESQNGLSVSKKKKHPILTKSSSLTPAVSDPLPAKPTPSLPKAPQKEGLDSKQKEDRRSSVQKPMEQAELKKEDLAKQNSRPDQAEEAKPVTKTPLLPKEPSFKRMKALELDQAAKTVFKVQSAKGPDLSCLRLPKDKSKSSHQNK